MGRRRGPILALGALLLLPVQALDTAPNSITAFEVYSLMNPCAQQCICYPKANLGPEDVVGNIIGCRWDYKSWASNDCYCRPDLQTVANSYLSGCVLGACKVGNPSIDMSSAVGLYRAYCASLRYSTDEFVAQTTTPSAVATPGSTPRPASTVTQTVYVPVYTSGAARRFVTMTVLARQWATVLWLVGIS